MAAFLLLTICHGRDAAWYDFDKLLHRKQQHPTGISFSFFILSAAASSNYIIEFDSMSEHEYDGLGL